MTTITREEWLTEFERVMGASLLVNSDGLTVQEIAQAVHMGPERVRIRLKSIQHQLVVGRKMVRGIDGRLTPAPCYRLKDGPVV